MSTAQKILSHPDVKLRRHGNEYRGNSPLRKGSDSGGFSLTIDDDEHGAWYDHAKNESGTLYDLAEKLGIEVPKRLDVITTKRTYTGLEDYAEAHGVEATTFQSAEWKEGTHYCSTHKKERPCLIYPTANGNRYRYTDGLKPPYINDPGYRSCWYGLDRAVEIAKEKSIPLVLCNGEASTVVGQHYGLPAAAVTNGEKRLSDELLKELKSKWQGEIILAYDCDETGRKVAREVKAQLDNKPAIVDLGFGVGGDLADFCKLYTSQAAEQILKRKPVQIDTSQGIDDPIKGLTEAIKELTKARKQIEVPEQIGELVLRAQSELDALRQKTEPAVVLGFNKIVVSAFEQLNENIRNPEEIRGIKCNIPAVDKAIGGFQKNRIYTFYGATNMGKSTLVVSFAGELIKQAPGLIIPTESPPQSWLYKLVARNLRITSDKLESGRLNPHEQDLVKGEMNRLMKLKCAMLHKGSPTVKDIEDAVKLAVKEYGIEWVIIDSMSNVMGTGNGIYEKTHSVSKGIQNIALENPVSIIQTVQIGRSVKERSNKNPGLHDATGASDVENDSDVVGVLYNHHYYVLQGDAKPDPKQPAGTALMTVRKHRWLGTVGAAVQLAFVGGSGFYEIAKPQEGRAG